MAATGVWQDSKHASNSICILLPVAQATKSNHQAFYTSVHAAGTSVTAHILALSHRCALPHPLASAYCSTYFEVILGTLEMNSSSQN